MSVEPLFICGLILHTFIKTDGVALLVAHTHSSNSKTWFHVVDDQFPITKTFFPLKDAMLTFTPEVSHLSLTSPSYNVGTLFDLRD